MAYSESFERLLQDLRQKQPGRFYVFTGEEAYLREFYLEKLRKLLTDEFTEAFNYHRLNADTFSAHVLRSCVDALPLMSEHSLVQLDDVELFGLPEVERNECAEILSDLPDYCTVVLVYDTVSFSPDKRKKKLAEALARACVVEFTRPTERDLSSFITKQLHRQGKAISPELCRYLIRITGGSMTRVHAELQKIAAYAAGAEITREDIDAVTEPVLEAGIFDLTDAIAAGRFDLALRKLETLMQLDWEPHPILGAIGSQLRRILAAKRVLAAGGRQRELMQLCGIKSDYAAGKTLDFARRLSDPFIDYAVERCLTANVQMNTSYATPKRALELLLLDLAQQARHD